MREWTQGDRDVERPPAPKEGVDEDQPIAQRTRSRSNLLTISEDYATSKLAPVPPQPTPQSSPSPPSTSIPPSQGRSVTSANRQQTIPSPQTNASTRVDIAAAMRDNDIQSVAFKHDLLLLQRIHQPLLHHLNLNTSLDERFLHLFMEAARSGQASMKISAPKSYEEDQSAPINEHLFHLLNLLSGSNDGTPESLQGSDFRSFLQDAAALQIRHHRPQLCKSSESVPVKSDRGCYFLISLSPRQGRPDPAFVIEVKRIDVASRAMDQIYLAAQSSPAGLVMSRDQDDKILFNDTRFNGLTQAEGNGKTILPQVCRALRTVKARC